MSMSMWLGTQDGIVELIDNGLIIMTRVSRSLFLEVEIMIKIFP